MINLRHINSPELNTKIYFTLHNGKIVPCIIINGSYISDNVVSNMWTWMNLKTQNIERGEGMFWEAVGVPQINEDKTEQELLRDFVLDVFELAK